MSIYGHSIADLDWSGRTGKTLAPSSAEGRHYRNLPRVAQEDDPELLEWLAKAKERGGHFVAAMATAGLHADWENYPPDTSWCCWCCAQSIRSTSRAML
jgi:hypothetical protein